MKFFALKQKRASWLGEIAFIGLSPFIMVATQTKVIAATLVPCGDVLPSVSSGAFLTEQQRDDVISSFLDGQCAARTIQALKDAGESLIFFRYYTTKSLIPTENISPGSYMTTDKFDTNLAAVTFLALDKQFGNNATSREFVDISGLASDTFTYQGIAGPQPPPPSAPNSCYPGGAQQTYLLFRDAVLSGQVQYTFDQYTIQRSSPCIFRANAIPEPSSLLGIGAIAVLGLAVTFSRTFAPAKT